MYVSATSQPPETETQQPEQYKRQAETYKMQPVIPFPTTGNEKLQFSPVYKAELQLFVCKTYNVVRFIASRTDNPEYAWLLSRPLF